VVQSNSVRVDPQTYTDPNAIMNALRAYSIEPGYTSAVDRWSYAIKKSEWDNMSMGLILQQVRVIKILG
jgi:hypothetical protein